MSKSENEQKGTSPKSPGGVLPDLNALKIGQNFNDTVGVKKAVLHVPVRKPTRQEFIRVHPSEEMRLPVAVIELKEDREVFLVAPELVPDLPDEVTPKLLLTTINRQGVLFLWPINLDLNQDRTRKSHWNETARTAAELATKGWIRVASNMALGSYEVFRATGNIPEPEWPELSFQEIIEIAFKDNYIRTADHVVIRKLLGAV